MVPVFICAQDQADAILASPKQLLAPIVHIHKEDNVTKFRLPEDPATPVVLVGTGTGLAPFLGFLQQRQIERKAAATPDALKAFGDVWLFFGCRHEQRDFLCRAELEAYVADGTLAQFHVAFSRDEGAEAKYVQDHMKKQGAALVKVLNDSGGVLYLCECMSQLCDRHFNIRGVIVSILQYSMYSIEVTSRLKFENPDFEMAVNQLCPAHTRLLIAACAKDARCFQESRH